MTQEQGGVSRDRILGITFPNAVTKDNLDKIARLRAEGGRTLDGSVAQVVVDEGNALQKAEIRKALDGFLTTGQRTDPPKIDLFKAYIKPAQALIDAEDYKPESDPFLHKEELERDARRILNQLLELRGKHLKQGESNEVTVFKASSGDPFFDKRKHAMLLRDKSPLEVIDHVTDEELQRWIDPDTRVALNLGRERFHQLYEAAQASTPNS